MLKKVLTLRNVGLLRNGSPTVAPFGHATLIYGENGRGKSTVATILRAASTHDASSIALNQTIDSDEEPLLDLLFADADGGANAVSLKSGAWTGKKPTIYVFDPSFVEDNVFSGQEVRADQRQALLQFALGEDSVDLEKKLAALVPVIAEATRRESEAARRIAALSKQVPPKEFIGLVDVPDADAQIEQLHTRIEAAKKSAELAQRPMPETLPLIELDISAFFAILQATFADIREDAKDVVLRHFQLHDKPPGIEAWVTEGRQYAEGGDCPFCGQDTAGSQLLGAYDAYFNRAYNEFMTRVGVLAKGVETRLSDSKLEVVELRLSANDARVRVWKDHIDIEPPQFDLELARQSVSALRELAGELAEKKQRSPLEPSGTEADAAAAKTLLAQIHRQIQSYNDAVGVTSREIRQFLTQLSFESPAALVDRIRRLEAVIARRSPHAITAIADFSTAEADKKRLNDLKVAARKTLDEMLPKTLAEYQGRINTLLRRFGASFEIVRLQSTYTGGTLRSDFALQMRGRSVGLGKRGANTPSFSTMLSEGDKRTLALTFFLARLQTLSGDLTATTVVFDDPMSSLDKKRRANTVRSIVEVVSRGAQVVVLSHDAHFLLELRKKLTAAPISITPTVHEIRRVQEGYSAFAACDLERICESEYFRSHRLVRDYVDAPAGTDPRTIAMELRPLIEGFLKRRFPHPLLPSNENLGNIIKLISTSDAPHLAHAKKYVAKLDALNKFDIKFHHNDGTDEGMPDDGELCQFARMTLEVIYGDYELA